MRIFMILIYAIVILADIAITAIFANSARKEKGYIVAFGFGIVLIMVIDIYCVYMMLAGLL